MHLGPHQFQAQLRYFEDSLGLTTSALWFKCLGITGCTLDQDALQNGTVRLIHARGILPDGLAFDMPECDAPPEPLRIGDLFPPTRDRLVIHLCLPANRPQGPNCVLTDGPRNSRFAGEERVFHDENTGGDERQVQIARKQFRLLAETESIEGMVTLPIARLMRDGSGRFASDPEFVAPCLQISSSERLMLILRRLTETLEEKSASLGRSGTVPGMASDLNPRSIANFWLRHAVNSGLSALRHLWISKRGHPEELYLELSRLAGALCTFSLQSHPSTLPLYDHFQLGECFEALDRHVREHLELIVPTNCVTIPLTRIDETFWEGDVVDARCLGKSRWVVGIQSAVGESELISRVPHLVKVCSAKFVRELVKRAVSGLELMHLPTPPAALTTRVEAQYFGISKQGPFWDNIVQTKRVGLYVPAELPQAELELQVVLDN